MRPDAGSAKQTDTRLTLFMSQHKGGIVIGHRGESGHQGTDTSGQEKLAQYALYMKLASTGLCMAGRPVI